MTSPSTKRPRLPISIIVPAYNAAATLSRALDSIDAQTCLPAEIILVDDASQDATWDVIQQLSGRHPDPPIKTVQLGRNSGPAAARNAGWAIASQEFLAFLDADDAWHPRKLELQHRWMADHAQVALCGHRCVVRCSEAPIPNLPAGDMPVRFYGVTSFLIANRLWTSSVMLRRKIGERFAAGKFCSEDFLLWVQIVANHGPAASIDLSLAFRFNARYGATGLSGDLWRMYRGELDSYAQLRRENIIGPTRWLIVVAWSWVKFFKRAVEYLSRLIEKSAAHGTRGTLAGSK
jgi:glycosyltransferase involved in cell wall biosynthesis